jgi:hypothetical protein
MIPSLTLALFVLPNPSWADFTVTIERVVDTSTPQPGGTSTFDALFPPAVDAAGTVVFYGRGANIAPFRRGIYKDNGLVLEVVADNATPAPDGLGTFLDFFTQPDISAGNIIVIGDYSDGVSSGEGVFKDIGAGLVTVDAGDINIREGSIDGESVAYRREGTFSEGIYSDFGGSLASQIGTGAAVPGTESFTFRFFGGPVIDSTQIVFEGRYLHNFGSAEGIYTKSLTTGEVDVLGDSSTLIPGTEYTFLGDAGCSSSSSDFFSPSTSDGSGVFYGWRYGPYEGIYSDRDGPLAIVADRSTAAPEGMGTFETFECKPIISHGNVVFGGTDQAGDFGYYADFDGSIGKVINVSDELDGRTISYLAHTIHGFDTNHFGFRADFTDGSSGIYVATLPEPSGALTLASGTVLLAALRSRRRLATETQHCSPHRRRS